jgi:hypothetical protein
VSGIRPSRTRTQDPLPDTGPYELRLADLRHTENTLAASTGASTKELRSRMGHASQAALIYQHATSERDQVLAEALSRLAKPVKTGRTRLRSVKAGPPQCSIRLFSS